MIDIIIGLVAACLGIAAGYLYSRMRARTQADSDENRARTLLGQARQQAEALKKEGELQARAEVIRAREEFEKSVDARRKEMSALEERINQRELNVERKVALIDKKEKTVEDKLAEIEKHIAEVAVEKESLRKLINEERDKLQKIAGLSQDEARKILMQKLEKEMHAEFGALIRKTQEEAKEIASRDARNILVSAVQRCAASHASELMTSTVSLPSDDMKGRIIGRDGRNIRSIEALTGVSVLIDDTPEAVVVSGFDPIRREIAKQSMEQLVADGRIHPGRIEEIVAKVTEHMEETIRLAGEEACFKTGAQGIPPEVMRMIGRLKFRTSFTQNVLSHSLEVSYLLGLMAGELGLDVQLARRIGLLHDIGKAMDHEVQGGHAIIGADLLKRHGEPAIVINAVAAHHEEVPAESPYAVLAAAADAISSARPGARSETAQIYINRLEKLESVANSFEGVSKSYAIHAGREVRILVDPGKIDDHKAMVMARDISKKIESELQYPGQIRVVVLRETRCVEYAK